MIGEILPQYHKYMNEVQTKSDENQKYRSCLKSPDISGQRSNKENRRVRFRLRSGGEIISDSSKTKTLRNGVKSTMRYPPNAFPRGEQTKINAPKVTVCLCPRLDAMSQQAVHPDFGQTGRADFGESCRPNLRSTGRIFWRRMCEEWVYSCRAYKTCNDVKSTVFEWMLHEVVLRSRTIINIKTRLTDPGTIIFLFWSILSPCYFTNATAQGNSFILQYNEWTALYGLFWGISGISEISLTLTLKLFLSRCRLWQNT